MDGNLLVPANGFNASDKYLGTRVLVLSSTVLLFRAICCGEIANY